MDNGSIARAEREYDTVLQRYRDEGKESRQRAFEEKERLAHLNRAADIQIRREQKFNIVTLEGRLNAIEPSETSQLIAPADTAGERAHLLTACDGYNIISNLSTDVHHWAHPNLRPQPRREPRQTRQIPAGNIKDFNIVSNRYIQDHEAKTARDYDLNRLEATAKYRQRNAFDPVLQRCTSARADERARVALDGRETEAVLRAQAQLPPTVRGRATEAHDLISNEVKDAALMEVHELAEQARTSRYMTRHLTDMAIHERDVLFQDAAMAQVGTQVSHERHEETARRGYDILTNNTFGDGPKNQKKHPPMTVPQVSAWEKAQQQAAPELPPAPRRPIGAEGPAPGPEASRGSSLSARQPPPGTGSSASRRLAEAGSRALSARGSAPSSRAPTLGSALPPAQASSMAAPPAPSIPGSSSGSVYARPRGA